MSNITTIERPRVATWTSIGTDVSECKNNLDEILSTAKLNYTVSSRPVTVDGTDGHQGKFHAIVRDSDNHVYNIAKNSYTICQNEEAFSLLNSLNNDVEVIRAGETPNGMIYIIAKMPDIKILQDSFTPHLIFQNSHTSDFALKVATVPLRIACTNQFSMAFPEARNTQTIKHTANISAQISSMNKVMSNIATYMEVFEDQASKLVKKQINIDEAIDVLFGREEDAATDRIANSRREAVDRFLSAYSTADNANFKGTAWGVLNAATEWLTHKPIRIGSENNHFVSTILYPDFTNKAFEYLRAA